MPESKKPLSALFEPQVPFNFFAMKRHRQMFQKIWGVIFFLAFSPAAWAFEVDGIYYSILSSDDKTVEVTYSDRGYSGDVTIPATITHNGTEYRVTAIGNYAFYGCYNGLTSVTIPNSVTSIGKEAFYNCTSLKSVTIPESVTTIGDGAFSRTGLREITIPESVTSIGSSAFSGCTGLTEFKGKFAVDNCCLIVNDTLKAFARRCEVTEYVIPNGVRAIGKEAFYGCDNLKSVTIPESVIAIGDKAFYGCICSSVTIPESVTSIGESAFSDCRGLTEFKGKFAVDNCCLIVNDTLKAFAPNCGLSEYIIPDGVKVIGDNAFYRCYDLTSVTIPESVTSIGDMAFYDCTGLKSVTIPNGVTTIGNDAFCGCSGLKSVTIPNGVTSIGDYAFNSCSGLKSVTIPNSVTTIGNDAFGGCKGLTSVTIPNSVTAIGGDAFGWCDALESVTIGEGVTTIGHSAFFMCENLTSVIAYNPTPVDIDGESVFYNVDCSNCTLYVPAESVEKYKAAEGWKKFGKILPISASAITEIQQDNADGHVTVYNLQGVLVLETDDAADLKTLQNGAYIVNGKTMIIAR